MSDSSEKSYIFPFGPTDIFSYIIPGSTAFLLIIIFEHWCRGNFPQVVRTPFQSIILSTHIESLNNNVILSIIYLLSALCIVYVAGHVVSSVSSLCLDRTYTGKGFGYPYENLLALPKKGGRRREDSMGFYQGLFFWINFYLVLRFLSFFYPTGPINTGLRISEWVICLTVALKIVSSIYLKHRERMRRTPPRWLTSVLKNYLRNVFPLGGALSFRVFNNLYNTKARFDSVSIAEYKQSFQRIFNRDPMDRGIENFWLCRLFILDKAPEIERKLTYERHMFIYTRNLATSFYLAFLYCFGWVFSYRSIVLPDTNPRHFTTLYLPLIYLAAAFFLMGRFRYLYISSYNRLLFRSFIYLAKSQN